MSKESEQNRDVVSTIIAAGIFSKVSQVLSKPQNVNSIVSAKIDKEKFSNDSVGQEAYIEAVSKLGYDVSGQTQHAITIDMLGNIAHSHEINDNPAKAEICALNQNKYEEEFFDLAVGKIVEGMQDGTIPKDMSIYSDEQVIDFLKQSDGSAEAEMEQLRSGIADKYMQQAVTEMNNLSNNNFGILNE